MLPLLLATFAASPLSPVGVAEREWRVGAYRESVRHGRVAFNVHNYGEDAHNLQVVGPHGYRSRITPDVEPGGNATLRTLLRRPGTYTLLCVKPGHVAKGMRTTIRVR
jgi:plastocyanin